MKSLRLVLFFATALGSAWGWAEGLSATLYKDPKLRLLWCLCGLP